MAQSNGPGPRAGGNPSRQARPNNSQEQNLDPRYVQQQPGQAGNWQQAQDPNGNHAQGGYQGQDPNAQYPNPTTGQPHYEDPNQYAPQFTPYPQQTADPFQQQQPAQGYAAPGQQQPHQTMENPAFPNGTQNQQYNPQQDPNAPGYNDWSQQGAQPPGAHSPDVHGYDAGGYAGAQPVAGQQPYPGGTPDYLSQPEYAHQADPFAVQPGTSYPDDPNAQYQGANGEYDQGYEEDGYAEDYAPETRGGISRMMMIAGALVGAIVVGGGLAYGWKMISGPGAKNGGETPVVRSGTSPSKTRPENPGGQQFDHKNSKIMGRLGGTGAKPSTTDANGTKQVPTISISRNGQVQPAAATGTPKAQPQISVPGLTVVDAFGEAQKRSPAGVGNANPIVVSPQKAQAGTKPRVQIRNAPKKPIVISKRTTPTTAPVKPKVTAPVAPKISATPKKPAPPSSTASVSKKAKIVATPPKTQATGSKGYVAVLASVPLSSSSRMSALMTYADLQQKYSAVLGSKTPDVKEANLGDRGKYHRLLVGPPGSRSQASALCAKLKGAGYSGCWVTAY